MRPEGFGMSILSIARVRRPSWRFLLAWAAVAIATVIVLASPGAPDRAGRVMLPATGGAAFADYRPARPTRSTAEVRRAPSTAPEAERSRALIGVLILKGLANRPFGPLK